MATSTYTPLANITLAADTNSVTFSSISQSYRDLVLVHWAWTSDGSQLRIRFNSDSGSNYNYVSMKGDGNTTSSTIWSNQTSLLWDWAAPGSTTVNWANNAIGHIMDYSTTDQQKTILNRVNSPQSSVAAQAHRWASTSAITTLQIFDLSGGNIKAGSTFALFGIASA